MTKVFTFGTFDCLHYGHINLLRRAAELGDYLYVGLSTDDFQAEKRKQPCRLSYKERKDLLDTISCVNIVFPETSWETKHEVMQRGDILVMGDDWAGKFDHLDVVYLPRTPDISSSIIRG
jgi:glycerol-3-phosphate cytidylyltransferase